MSNRCTFQVTLYSQAPLISWHQESADCCEAIPRQVGISILPIRYHHVFFVIQVTYLIDEASNVGKGANTIISMLHHFFEVHRLGETTAHLHADNCTGQNKNRFMINYLMWMCLTGLHEEIKISLLLVGHTKFAPDWCFGLLKQCIMRTKIEDLDDIANCVSWSSIVNVPQLLRLLDGTNFVPTYDWSTFFEETTIKTALKGITQLHHFWFSKHHPGKVFVKEAANSNAREINLLKETSWRLSSVHLPTLLIPNGLSQEWKQYLFEKIRQFCPKPKKDIVCPQP